MGKYDFRPQRVHHAATRLLGTERLANSPSWYNIIGVVPPAQTLVRTQPLEHRDRIRKSKMKKPSKLFQPRTIVYPEDRLRREFFGDHPWELARPRVVLENDGKDARPLAWDKIRQPGRPVDGESVVQRQMWLMNETNNLSKERAYDQARQEFYNARLQENVERRVAKEEAMACGAYFGKSSLQVGMELEDKEYERWKEWASKEYEVLAQQQPSQAGLGSGDAALSPDDPDIAGALDEIGSQITS